MCNFWLRSIHEHYVTVIIALAVFLSFVARYWSKPISEIIGLCVILSLTC
jgi:hypothetical protein